MKIILYSDDINLITFWEKSINEEYVVYDELDELKNSKGNLIIINYSAFNSIKKEVINSLNEDLNYVLILHRTPDIDTAREVLAYGAKGYGNALMKRHFLRSAIEAIREGMVWLHPEFTSKLITQMPTQNTKDISRIFNKLSKREKEVAYLLGEGDTYKVVADKLDIKPRTIKAHAKSIYTKLHVKDRLALALLLK
jgi:DNA-binding NarL/FixJ family response regulator